MRLRLGAVALVVLAAACSNEPAARSGVGPSFSVSGGSARTYVILGSGGALPSDFASQVEAAGGSVSATLGGIGVGIAVSDEPGFAGALNRGSGIQAVAEDVILDFGQPSAAGEIEAAAGESDAGQASHGSTESFRNIQWAPDAISAPAAWHAGYRGAGARVAILDGGLYSSHVDIALNLDAARSASFVPGQAYNTDLRRNAQNQFVLTDTFWHGTHVAGIVAARANNIGTVGIAPEATLIGVKVLHCGSGAFSWIIQGIYYAATPIAEGGAGAHIINMSLGALIDGRGPGIAHLLNALSRATSYANQRGVTVIAAAGNNAVDIDHTNNMVFVPAQSVGVIAVSATSPAGWALGSTNLDVPTAYTNYGQSAITLAGPGGDDPLFGTPQGSAACTKPRIPTGSVTTACWVFDLVMAPCRGSASSTATYCWAAGTSMASPAVAGVAALLVGKNGPMHPAQLEAALRASADDLGKPGNDDFYGRGRVNAWRAVQ